MQQQIFADMQAWAREMGAIQIGYFRHGHLGITNKLNESDIVTNADLDSNRCILDHIRRKYPDHSILSEETGTDTGTSDYRWVIDPLDGTTNFSQGLPLFAVSIGLEYRGRTVAGVVYAPYLDEMFTAQADAGATLNGKPIRVSGKTDPHRSVVATGFPVDKHLNADNNLDNFARLFTHFRGIRRLGSAAMDLCYCAAGILDGYWEMNLHQWDVSAGELILAEAGGLCSQFRTDRNISICAGTPAIHNYILERLKA